MTIGTQARRPGARLALAVGLLSGPVTTAKGQRANSAHVTVSVAAAPRAGRGAPAGSFTARDWPATLTISMKPGWHIYGTDAGTAGLPTRTIWKLANGWSVASVTWPAPARQIRGRDSTFEYEGSIAVPFVLRGPVSGGAHDPHALTVSVGVCKSICIPEKVTVEFRSTTTGGGRTPAR